MSAAVPQKTGDRPRVSLAPGSPVSLARWKNVVCPRLLLGFFGLHQPALAHRLGEILEQRHAVLPADAGIGDALAVYERLSRNEILASRLEVRFHHEADDAVFAGGNLARNLARDVDLALIHLLAVRVTAID